MSKNQGLLGGFAPRTPPNRGADPVPRQGPAAPWIPAFFLFPKMVKNSLRLFSAFFTKCQCHVCLAGGQDRKSYSIKHNMWNRLKAVSSVLYKLDILWKFTLKYVSHSLPATDFPLLRPGAAKEIRGFFRAESVPESALNSLQLRTA